MGLMAKAKAYRTRSAAQKEATRLKKGGVVGAWGVVKGKKGYYVGRRYAYQSGWHIRGVGGKMVGWLKEKL